eukprot:g269.t1
MPMLTSTGYGVFEVGLNHADSLGHVLPVFRLPSVDETVTFINRIPTEPTEEEAKRIEEDRKDEEALASQLGLTEEELAEFEMEVEQITGHDNNGSRSRSQSLAEFGDSTANLPPLDFSQTIEGKESIIREEGSTLSLNKVKGRKRRREGDPDEHGTRQLTTSVHLIRDLTEKVREDIAEIHRTAPMVNVNAQLYMQRWGMEKFEKIFKRIEMQKERAALHLWQDKVKQLIKMEKRENYMKLRASRKLDHFVHRMQSNEMASAFHLWLSQMLEQKERERRKAEDDAACAEDDMKKMKRISAKAEIAEAKGNKLAMDAKNMKLDITSLKDDLERYEKEGSKYNRRMDEIEIAAPNVNVPPVFKRSCLR